MIIKTQDEKVYNFFDKQGREFVAFDGKEFLVKTKLAWVGKPMELEYAPVDAKGMPQESVFITTTSPVVEIRLK